VTKLDGECNIAGTIINFLDYADDIVLSVLVRPSNDIESCRGSADDFKMTFDNKNTVCITFNPCNKRDVVYDAFTLTGCELIFIEQFQYLINIIDNKLVYDIDI